MPSIFKKIISSAHIFFSSLNTKRLVGASLLVIIFFCAQTIICNKVSAQSAQTSAITINASTPNPQEGDNVTLTVSSYSVDLDSAKITWYVDGTIKENDIGAKSLVVQAKNGDQATEIKVVVETSDGTTFQSSTEVRASDVDLIIEPTSYVPPFYKGNAIFASQGTAKIIAIPDVLINGSKASSKNLIFRWSVDDTYMADDSGMGKDSITVNGSVPIRDIDVDVEVLDSSGNTLATNSTVVTTSDPAILFYEDSPIYGILYNEAITNNYYLGTKEEVNIIAEPFFFNLNSDSGNDSTYQWTANGSAVSSGDKPNELLMKQEQTNLVGSASVSLTVNNISKIFQYATAGFNISFGQ